MTTYQKQFQLESYESPKTFEAAWCHENNFLKGKWREAIKKELENMEKNKVWRVTSKDKFPTQIRLLGTKWVYKVKKSGIFKAQGQ